MRLLSSGRGRIVQSTGIGEEVCPTTLCLCLLRPSWTYARGPAFAAASGKGSKHKRKVSTAVSTAIGNIGARGLDDAGLSFLSVAGLWSKLCANTETGHEKKPCFSSNTRLFLLAQKEGFEPSRPFSDPTPLAGEPLRPLGYFCTTEPDIKLAEREGFEPPVPFGITGFQDQRHKPLGHLSITSMRIIGRLRRLVKQFLPVPRKRRIPHAGRTGKAQPPDEAGPERTDSVRLYFPGASAASSAASAAAPLTASAASPAVSAALFAASSTVSAASFAASSAA